MQTTTSILRDSITMEQAYDNLRQRTKALPSPFDKAKSIQAAFPSIASSVLKEAQDAMDGLVLLPGNSQKSRIGNPPGWHENPYNNNEYVFQISRMNHWLPMMYAYFLTRQESYAKKILEEMVHWINVCPRPPLCDSDGRLKTESFNSPAAKEWRLLECGIRPYRTWCPAIEGLCHSRYFTQEVFETVLTSLYEHCEVVYRISPLAWPKADHNHYLMENLGLLAVSCMFPELKDSDRWKEHAIVQLCRCMENQVDDQGAQTEGCPSYHNGCLFWFAMVMVYGRKYGFTLPESYTERFSRMAVHSIYATRPNGTNVPWGDTSTLTGTLTKAAVCTYLGTADADILSLCLNFYSYEDILKEAEEQIWRMDDPGDFARAMKNCRKKEPELPLLCCNHSLKHIYFRSGWDREALSVMFACRSPIKNNHAHIDPCGFDFTAYGIPMAVDPGKYTYQDGEDRKHFKSMMWHNTLTVNHKDAWEYLRSWAYGPQKEGRIQGCGEEDGLIWAMASHENYEPVLHTRGLALVQNRFLLVIDVVRHLKPKDSIQIQFHIDRPVLTVFGNTGTAAWDQAAYLTVTSSAGRPVVLPAKVSDRNDVYRDSSILQYNRAQPDETEVVATVLYPSKETTPPAVTELTASWNGDARVSFKADGIPYTFYMTGSGINRPETQLPPDAADREETK